MSGVSDTGDLGDVAGVVGDTTANLKTQATYTNWDFTQNWKIASGDYPRCRWE